MTNSDDHEILIEITAPEGAAEMALHFPDCEILTSRGFSGQEIISLITKPSAAFFKRLADWLFRGAGQGAKGTKVKIGKSEMTLENFTAEEVGNLLENHAFQKALREMKKK